MSRLSDILVNSAGNIHYRVSGLHQDDEYSLEIAVTGACNLRCQRCLEEFSFPLNLTTLLLLTSVAQLNEIECESGDAIEAKSQLDVLELVEDEVLLGLPFAPKHPEGTCEVPSNKVLRSDNPFAVLAGFRSNN